MSEGVRELVTTTTDLEQLRRQGMKEGMRPLRVSGAQKVGQGVTTIAEVLRVSPASQSF
jgi:general secretion pathway protein E